MAKVLFLSTCLVGLLALAAASEEPENVRTSRQLLYSGKPVYQPSIQYYFINKVQNGPVADAREYERFLADAENPGYYNPYEGAVDDAQGNDAASFRQGLFGGIFNNRFSNGNTNLQTFRPLASFIPPFVRNPNFNGLLSTYEPCTANSGESGICVGSAACSLYGGKASGSCGFASVCCVNTATKCGATVTLNNTYFQAPATALTTPTSCNLNIKLDTRLAEQTLPICQVRLDFVSFSIAQPAQAPTTSATQCLTDTFQVGGSLNTVPTICGDNDGQHMYLHTSRSDISPSSLRLTFNLGTASVTRAWNIKIAMLPCVSPNLAPADCLQYFSSSSGTVSSFNWKDVAPTVRQLANQNYKICFRTELVNNKRANTLCLTQCSVTNGGNPFTLTLANGGNSGSAAAACTTDYLVFVGGTNTAAAALPQSDRYCGGALNPVTGQAPPSVTVCSTSRPFEVLYVTDGFEAAAGETTNTGFCLTYQQSSN